MPLVEEVELAGGAGGRAWVLAWESIAEGDDEEDVLSAMRLANDVYAARICACDQYLVADDMPACVVCDAAAPKAGDTATEQEEAAKEVCAVCMEAVCVGRRPRCLVRMECCRKVLHRACLNRCNAEREASDELPACVHCRAPCPRRRGSLGSGGGR